MKSIFIKTMKHNYCLALLTILFIISGVLWLFPNDVYAGSADEDPDISYEINYSGNYISLYLKDYDISPDESVVVKVRAIKDGLNSAKWLKGDVLSTGRIHTSIDLTAFNSSGRYQIRFYKMPKSGIKELIRSTYIDVPGFDKDDAMLSIEKEDPVKGRFSVCLNNLCSAYGIQKVRFAIWTKEDGQDDLIWAEAEKQANGSYKTEVTIKDHKNTGGVYCIDAYAVNSIGEKKCIAALKYDFQLSENILSVSGTKNDIKRTAAILNPSAAPDEIVITPCSDPTKEYLRTELFETDNNIWSCELDCRQLHCDMTYKFSFYSDGKLLKDINVVWNADTTSSQINSNQEMFDLAQKMNSGSNYLILLDRSIHRVGIFHRTDKIWRELYYWPCVTGAAATPSPVGTYTITWRKPSFGDGTYICWYATNITGSFYFHSQPYVPDTGPYILDDPVMDCAASHGCIRLYLEYAIWIYENIPNGTTVYIYN